MGFCMEILNWSKVKAKKFVKIVVPIVLWKFQFMKEFLKNLRHSFLNKYIIRSTTVFKINNNDKCFLSSQSAY